MMVSHMVAHHIVAFQSGSVWLSPPQQTVATKHDRIRLTEAEASEVQVGARRAVTGLMET